MVPPATEVTTVNPTNVAVLGSTGSIGSSTLEVIAGSHGRLAAAGLSAHTRLAQAVQQAWEFRPRWLVATDPTSAAEWRTCRGELPAETTLLVGADEVSRMVTRPEIDVVVAAIVGSAGLQSTWAALEAGKKVALANKETLVVAGPLVMAWAASRQASIVPVYSENRAIWQALQSDRSSV